MIYRKCVCIHAKSFQSCLNLCNAMDCSPPGSSVHGVFQARILEWVAMPFSRRSPDSRIKLASLTSPAFSGWFFTQPKRWVEGIWVPVPLPGRVSTTARGILRLTSLSLFPFIHWRRRWQPTPVFLPGESEGRGSLVGCRPLGHTESDMPLEKPICRSGSNS